MTWVSTDNANTAVTTNHFAVTAHFFYRSTNFHLLLQHAFSDERGPKDHVSLDSLSLTLSHIVVTLSALALEP